MCALAMLALPATSGADRVARLRADKAALATREHAAVLQLYALNTSLDRTRGRLAKIANDLAAARRDRNAARRQLRIAQRTLSVAEKRLGGQLRALYESDRPDTLSVLFGAATLDDVITELDDVNRSTASTSAVIVQARQARASVRRLLASLDRRASRLSALRSAAAAQTATLTQAEGARSAYIDRLRTQERLTSQRISQLQAQAQAAEAASTVVTVQAQTATSFPPAAPTSPAKPPKTKPTKAKPTPPAPPPPPPPAPPTPPAAPTPIQPASGSGKQLTVVATAYALHGGTASGLPTGPGVVAVDPTVIPLGTRMYIPGYGPGIAADTGTAIKGLRIDLWFPTLAQTYKWGRRTVTITLR
ncbi:MAG TPA: 3D domain-containing protein [Gaiellaceae bacterium]|nr:3D domain-containing protein [Gaiellaceae bacterium]